MNETLENALKETWEKKDRFYEENKYGVRGISHNVPAVYDVG
jgi:hypothetical protein